MNGHIEKRTSKTRGTRYRVLVFVDADHGGPRWETHGTFDREKQATAMLVKVLDGYFKGVYRKPSRLTVRQLYDRWRAVKAPEWSPNTRRHHKMNFTHHIEEELGDELAEMLPKDRVATWQADLLTAGCAPKSVSGYRGTLHAMYVWGIEVDLVAANPVAAVKPPQLDRADHDALTVPEMRAYLEALRGTRLWPGLLLGAGGGLRRGEFLAVRWSRLQIRDKDGAPEGGVIVHHKDGNLTGRTRATLVLGPPKGRRGRVKSRFVPLPAAVLAALADLKRERQEKWMRTGLPWDDDAFVCCGLKGQLIVPDGFTHELQRLCKRRGLTHTHPHAFRHGFVEAMLGAGERLDVVQAAAGHADAATTSGIYAHVTEAAVVSAAGRYGSLWDKPAAEPEQGPDQSISTQSATILGGGDELARRRRKRVPA